MNKPNSTNDSRKRPVENHKSEAVQTSRSSEFDHLPNTTSATSKSSENHRSEGDDEARAYLRQKIQHICKQKRIELENDRITDSLNLYQSGILDSFDLYEFLVSIQNELSIEFDIAEREPESFTSFGRLAQLILECRSFDTATSSR